MTTVNVEDEALHGKKMQTLSNLRSACYCYVKSFILHTKMLSADPELGICNKKGRYN